MLKKVILGGALCSATLLVGCASTNVQVPASAWTTSGMNQYLHNAKTLKDVRALLGEETLARKDKATSQRVSIWELEESRPGFYKEGSPCDEQEYKPTTKREIQVQVDRQGNVVKKSMQGMSYVRFNQLGVNVIAEVRSMTKDELAFPRIPIASGEIREKVNAYYMTKRK